MSATITSSSISSSAISVRSDGFGGRASLIMPVVKFKPRRRE
jgi:hypothetical protein